MRLLFDEQLSEELCSALVNEFPGALHVRQLGAGGSSDSSIWSLAREQNCILVTKDEDFRQLGVLRGAPPKVIWLRCGNQATAAIEASQERGSHRRVPGRRIGLSGNLLTTLLAQPAQ